MGCIQIPGVEFTKIYSPVVTGITLRVILNICLINMRGSQNIDAVTEFLYSVLEKEIYTKIPKGMADAPDKYYKYKDILQFIKYIYGNVQASHYWFKEYTKKMSLKAGL